MKKAEIKRRSMRKGYDKLSKWEILLRKCCL